MRFGSRLSKSLMRGDSGGVSARKRRNERRFRTYSASQSLLRARSEAGFSARGETEYVVTPSSSVAAETSPEHSRSHKLLSTILSGNPLVLRMHSGFVSVIPEIETTAAKTFCVSVSKLPRVWATQKDSNSR